MTPANCRPAWVCPPTIDGGTRLRSSIVDHQVPDVWRALFEDFRSWVDAAWARQQARQGGRVLALPRWPGGPYMGAAEVSVTGARRQIVTLHVVDRCWVRLNLDTREVELQAKAKELWSGGAGATGWRLWCETWIPYWTWALQGDVLHARIAHPRWRVTGVELCADATGLQFQREDADRFIGFRSSGTDGVSTEKEPSIRVWGTPGDVESIMLGTRSGSAVSLIIYAKDVEIAREKGGDGSTYDAIHRAHGWDGEAPRTRIEWRINGVGLTLTQWQTGEVIDLRDPWLLGQPETLSQLWAAVAEKRRLIVPTRTRNTRSETDPRWAFVQTAALEEHRTGSEKWRQARFVESDTHDRRVERATRDAIRALHRVAQLHDRSVHVAGGLPAVAERLGSLNPPALKDGIEYGDTYGFLQRNILKDEIERAGRDNWPARKRKAK